MGNGGRRQCQCHAVNSTHRSGHLALDALRVTPHSMRGPVCESPHTRCEVQCMSHPAPRCGVQEKGRRGIHLPVFLDTASQRSMTRWRGPVRPQRERAEQTPPLSGREEANRPRKKGEDCLSTASSAAPEGGDSLRAKKPDNSGGASWFVLLAVEKNEHTVSPRTTMRGPEREGKGQVPQTIFLDTASQRSMTRWRGPVRPQRERAEQIPPLSGREEANRPRKKGEDCLSTASSAAPEGGDSLRAKKPDNSGGASWFVLLAVEKNEHTVSPRTTMRGSERGLLWVLPLPVFPARVFLDSASSAE